MVLLRSRRPGGRRTSIDFLQAPAARAVLQRYGFAVG